MRKQYYLGGLLLLGLSTCTHLDDPFAGLTAAQVFTLSLVPVPTPAAGATGVPTLPADGQSVLEGTLKLQDAALYSQVTATVASDALTVSTTGSATGGLHSLSLPFAGPEGHFYLVAPRNYQESAFLSVTVGRVQLVQPIKLSAVEPSQLDVTPTTVRASVGTPFSFVTTLSSTSPSAAPVSGQLRIQLLPTDPAKKTVALFPPLSMAQADGTATITTTTTLGDTGTYSLCAAYGSMRSRPFVIRCR